MRSPRAEQHSPANEARLQTEWEKRVLRHAVNWLDSGWDIGDEFMQAHKVGLGTVRQLARKHGITLPGKSGRTPCPREILRDSCGKQKPKRRPPY